MEQFNKYFVDTIKNRYAKFDGRASRSEFWYFMLFYFILSVIVGLIDALVLNPMMGVAPADVAQGEILRIIVALALLVPSIALIIRRLHDTGKSGWWLLIVLIPIVGALALLYFYVVDSERGMNRFGMNPKGL